MDLIVDLPPLNLYDPELPIYTTIQPLPSAKTGPHAGITRSLVSHGCIINGVVRNSVLSPGVYVEAGAQVLDSIIFDDTVIAPYVTIHRSIVDKQCWVGAGAHIGFGDDWTPNREEPTHLNTGITLVGKGAKIPADTKVGRNCKIDCWVEPEDFPGNFIPSGTTVLRTRPRHFPA